MTRVQSVRVAIAAAIQATTNDAGEVTPDGVVEAARDEASPLHAEFEWDDSVAAHQHRLAQARYLIREIRYEVSPSEERVISAISYVHTPGMVGQGYVMLSKIARSKKQAQAVIEMELTRCEGAMRRAREVADVLGLRDEVDDALRNLTTIRRKAVAKSKGSAKESRVE